MPYDIILTGAYSPPRYGNRRGYEAGSDPAPRRPPHAPAAVSANPVLGVFGLSIRTSERDLEDEFLRYGEVEKVVIVYDQRVSSLDLELAWELCVGADKS